MSSALQSESGPVRTVTAPASHLIGSRLLRAIGFLSFYDRFATAPMIVLIAYETKAGMAAAASLVTVYALCYAIGQPIWGILSDRVGRLRILRMALVGAAVGSTVSVAAPTFPILLASRAGSGLFVGALFPTVLTLIGDRFQSQERTKQVSALQVFTALGTTLATFACGAVGAWMSWRISFGLTTVGAIILLILTHDAKEQLKPRGLRSPSTRAAFTLWPLLLYMIGIVEGGLLLGVFTFITPVMQQDGISTAAAGALAATYGVGIIAGSQVMRRVAGRFSLTVLIAAGGTLLTAAFVIAAADTASIYAMTAAAITIGLSYSFLHGSLQTWATSAAPQVRATTVSFFIGAVFLGSSIATAIASPVIDHPSVIFSVATLLTAALTFTATVLHSRWARLALPA